MKKFNFEFEIRLGQDELLLFTQFSKLIEPVVLAMCDVDIDARRLRIAGELDSGDLPETLRDMSITLCAAGLRDRVKFAMREFGEVVCEHGAL